MKPHVSRVTALFLLCQVFLILTHAPLVRVLSWIILSGDVDVFTEKGAAKTISIYNTSSTASNEGGAAKKKQVTNEGSSQGRRRVKGRL